MRALLYASVRTSSAVHSSRCIRTAPVLTPFRNPLLVKVETDPLTATNTFLCTTYERQNIPSRTSHRTCLPLEARVVPGFLGSDDDLGVQGWDEDLARTLFG